ncbi:hypothetical protein DFH09DRAFT_1196167 [Mycena vulgaris]|nr:hypothetical protein DFH09DRAFT_1196167 [Mycena vulgaris]
MLLGQFSASVSVGGVELAEHAVEYSADGTQATCWIASEDDKQFCVKFKNRDAKRDYTVSAKVSVDGISCGGRHLHYSGRRISSGSRDSVSTSANTRRPLTFAKQALTDDDAYLNAPISPDLGAIRVVFAHVKVLAAKEKWKGGRFEPQILHERSKKAIGHSVQFGPEFRSRQNRRGCSKPIADLVTFVFKYRPIGLLRAEGIAPLLTREERTIPPEDVLDLTMDMDEEDEEDAEIEKLEARLGALKNKKKRVKREPGEVKREIKNEEMIFKPGEVIDLT